MTAASSAASLFSAYPCIGGVATGILRLGENNVRSSVHACSRRNPSGSALHAAAFSRILSFTSFCIALCCTSAAGPHYWLARAPLRPPAPPWGPPGGSLAPLPRRSPWGPWLRARGVTCELKGKTFCHANIVRKYGSTYGQVCDNGAITLMRMPV